MCEKEWDCRTCEHIDTCTMETPFDTCDEFKPAAELPPLASFADMEPDKGDAVGAAYLKLSNE